MVGLLLLLVGLGSLTTWRPTRVEPMRRPRALGQLLLTTARLYWSHAAVLLLIALASLALLGAVNGLEFLVRRALARVVRALTSRARAVVPRYRRQRSGEHSPHQSPPPPSSHSSATWSADTRPGLPHPGQRFGGVCGG